LKCRREKAKGGRARTNTTTQVNATAHTAMNTILP